MDELATQADTSTNISFLTWKVRLRWFGQTHYCRKSDSP